MKRIKLVNILSVIFLIPLLSFFVTSSCKSQSNREEVIEKYRLKIIGETINLLEPNHEVKLDSISVLEIGASIDRFQNNAPKSYELIKALLETSEYKKTGGVSAEVPVVEKTEDLNSFYEFIEENLNQTTKGKPEFRVWKKNSVKHIDDCKKEIDENKRAEQERVEKERVEKERAEQERALLKDPKLEKGLLDGITMWNILSILNFLFFIVILVLFLIKRRNLNEHFEKLDKQNIDDNNFMIGKLNALQIKSEKLQADINNVDIKASGLENKMMKLEQRRPETTAGMGAFNSPRPRAETPPPIIHKYSSYPDNPDGFLISSLSNTENSDSRYEFIMENDNVASFIFKASPNETEFAINNAQMFLRSACDYNNSPNEGKRIRTDKPGRLVRDGVMWRIVDKAKISFYN